MKTKIDLMLEDYDALIDPSDSREEHRTKSAAFCHKNFETASEKEIAIRQRYLKAGIMCTSHGWPESDIELFESKEVQDILKKYNDTSLDRRKFLHSIEKNKFFSSIHAKPNWNDIIELIEHIKDIPELNSLQKDLFYYLMERTKINPEM